MEFGVNKDRLGKADQIILTAAREFNDSDFMEFMDHMGWFDLFRYGESGAPELALNDLQTIAVAAALAAYREWVIDRRVLAEIAAARKDDQEAQIEDDGDDL